MDAYRRWISEPKNYAKMKQVEDMARMMTLLVPVRNSDVSLFDVLSDDSVPIRSLGYVS